MQFISEIVIYAMPFQGAIPDHTDGTKCHTFVMPLSTIENILNSENTAPQSFR